MEESEPEALRPRVALLMTSILDVLMVCPLCGWRGKLGAAAPAVNSDGEYGCPVVDCGGIVKEIA